MNFTAGCRANDFYGNDVHEIYEAFSEPDLNVRCLYSGDLPDELARAAPYVVELDTDRVFTDAFREAWGQSWGILLRSSADIEALRRRFKKLNIVRGPDGKRLLFRYYDPRVLRVFLPTCDEPQLAQMFGPVREFITDPRKVRHERHPPQHRTARSVRALLDRELLGRMRAMRVAPRSSSK